MVAAPQKVAKSTRVPVSGVVLAPKPEIQEAEEGPVIRDGSRRVPFGQHVAKLTLPQRPGFVRRWVNDVPGRIQKALGGGYVQIMDGNGKPLTNVVDRTTGLIAYAMEIPQEFYNEDRAAKEESLDATDKSMHNGTFNKDPDAQTYAPNGAAIKFQVQRGSGRG